MQASTRELLLGFLITGALLSITGLETATAAPSPDWVKQIPAGTWAAVSFNTLRDVDPAKDPDANPNFPRSPPWTPYQQMVLEAWNGGAFATGYGKSGALIVCGGGHYDYFGNEVYAFDLESRLWQRLTNPYPSPAFPVVDGIWPDGTPSVAHTYDQVDYHPGTNSFVMMRTQYDNTGGQNTPIVAMFSLDDLKPADLNENRNFNKRNWRWSHRHTSMYARSGGWSAYDPKRDVLWANGGDGTDSLVSFDPKTAHSDGRYGTFQTFPKRSTATNAVAAYDPVNDIVVFTIFRDAPLVFAIDLSQPDTGSRGNVTLVQAGSPPPLEQAHGWEWSPTRRAFIYYRRGAGVFEFKQSGRDWRTGPWTWTQLTSHENGLTPAGESRNGVFSKFRIAHFDDAEVALVVTRTDGPVYAFRIPDITQDRKPRPPSNLTTN